MTRRVVITGIGMVTPCGNSTSETWDNIKNGRSGVAPITLYDPSDFTVKIAAEAKNFRPEDYMPGKEVRRRDRYQHFITAAAKEAIGGSGLTVTDENRDKIGVFIGSAVAGVSSYYELLWDFFETRDARAVTPFAVPMLMGNGGSALISIEYGMTGPSYVLTSACASGADCIGHAFDMIRLGRLDAAVTGAGEAPVIPIGIAAFDRIGACSRDNDTPKEAVRPFSKDRSGLVFAEGAGVLVLEALEVAQARGAVILGEVVGYGSTSDSFHITAPHPSGGGAARAIRMAMDDARVGAEDIHYINAHGTATSLNDAMETQAVKAALGQHAYNVPMSSTKSMTGHGMGFTAAIEAAFAALAIRDNVAPPTINLREPDPACDLDYVPHTARETRIDCVMSNSFGFGGHNASLIIKRFVG